MGWVQVYDPLGSAVLSPMAAGLLTLAQAYWLTWMIRTPA